MANQRKPKIEFINGEEATELSKHFPNAKDGFIRVGEKGWHLPHKYAEDVYKIINLQTRPDDTWIISYPRSGTTLTEELVWLVANNLNFDEALRRKLLDRFPFIENSIFMDKFISGNRNIKEKWDVASIEFVHEQPSPRFIKSHLSFELLPTDVKQCKIIYVARNPKDVVVSYYHLQKDLELISYQGTFEQFCDYFMTDRTLWSPYWEHVKEAWAIRHESNILFLFYEDLRKDLAGCIKKVAAFYDKNYDDEQLATLIKHLDINNFRKNSMVNSVVETDTMKPEQFIRQGQVGSWKKMFTPEMEKRFDKWIEDNLKNTDLIFPS